MVAIVRRAVIDASVALKWRLPNEESAAQAKALLDDCERGALSLLAPTLFDFEIANALRTAVLRGRITEADAIASIADFNALVIERPDFRDTQKLALQMGCQYQCSAYDAAYLVLAQANNLWFFTGDRRLHNAVSAQLPWVKWIGDYSFDVIPIVPP